MYMTASERPNFKPNGGRVWRLSLIATLLIAALAWAPPQAWAKKGGKKFTKVNLVSDLPNMAVVQDAAVVNPWGMSLSSSSPFWVSDNGTGVSTVYSVTPTAVTKLDLTVTIPGIGVTGQVFAGGAFAGENFLFVTEDGTISGWRQDLGTAAEVLVTRPGAVYMGATIAQSASGPRLLVANFSEATIDVYDMSLVLVTQWSDPDAPEGYAPFNVQALGDTVYVAYAKQNEEKEDEVVGDGFGFVDIVNADSGQFERLASGKDVGGKLKVINAPWGLAIAPATFGKFAGDLLVGNFGSGTIMAFNPTTGKYRGLLKNDRGKTLEIEGLWALAIGNGAQGGDPAKIYFTAGIQDEVHGLFGSLTPVAKSGGGGGGGY